MCILIDCKSTDKDFYMQMTYILGIKYQNVIL